MHIVVAGLSYRRAPLAARESLAIDLADRKAAYERLMLIGREAFILSTCNRLEVYATDSDRERLASFIAHPYPHLREMVYSHESEDAIHHLFRVCAGLDSAIVGEQEIMGQVRASLADAREHGALGPLLGRVGSAALHAARRARDVSALGRCPASYVTLGLEAVRALGVTIESSSVAVLGAGAMAEGVLRRIARMQPRRITVTSRTAFHAQQLAGRYGALAVGWQNRVDAITAADLVVACTSSIVPVVLASDVAVDRRVTFLDLGVPRDIDPAVRAIAGISLIDIDQLQQLAARNQARRAEAALMCEDILARETARFGARWQLLAPVTA